MKQLLLSSTIACAFSLTFASNLAFAEDAKPEHEVSFNLAAVSEYRYRGISQSRMDPALQGGADYTHTPSGFYAGTWLSSIKWTKDAGGSGELEMDLYAGKKGEISPSVTYDIGVLSYVYPSNGLDKVSGFSNANTTEIYAQLGSGPAYIKYSYGITDLFGFVDSKRSGYLDIGANLEVTEGVTLGLHVGSQNIKNNSAASYQDWKISLNKEYIGINFGLALLGTNADKKLYFTPEGKFTGNAKLVLSAVKTF